MSSHLEAFLMMNSMHQSRSPAASLDWPLERGQARRLQIGPGARCLRVAAGQVWLTETRAGLQSDEPATDHWLQAGEQHYLASGSEVVVEARGEARFQLLVPPQVCAPQGRRRTPPMAWMRRAMHSLWQPGSGRVGVSGSMAPQPGRVSAAWRAGCT